LCEKTTGQRSPRGVKKKQLLMEKIKGFFRVNERNKGGKKGKKGEDGRGAGPILGKAGIETKERETGERNLGRLKRGILNAKRSKREKKKKRGSKKGQDVRGSRKKGYGQKNIIVIKKGKTG